MTLFRPAQRRPDAARVVLFLLGGLTLGRVVYGARLGLAEDEAYYWQWSRHLALSFYDQGPGIAYLMRLTRTLAGDTHLGVRLGAILLSAATTWLLFLTARRWFDARVAVWSAALATVAPLLAAGGILATYDNPQVFFWAAGMYALTRTLQEKRVAGWYGVGFLVGLGALCKLTGLLFAPCVLVFLLLSPTHRRWLGTPHPYLGFALALILFAPVVIWNAQHEWMGFLHSFTLGNRTRNAQPFRWFGEFLGGQALALGPPLFVAELIALARLAFQTGPAGPPSLLPPSPPSSPPRPPSLGGEDSAGQDAPAGRDAGAGQTQEPGQTHSSPPKVGGRGGELRGQGGSTGGPEERSNRDNRDGARFVVAFGAPILLLCLAMSLRSKLEINWAVPTHLAGLLAVAVWFADAWEERQAPRPRPGARVGIFATVSVSLLLTLIALFPSALPAVGFVVPAETAQKLNQTYGWPIIARAVQSARQSLVRQDGRPVFVAGINYRVNSVLAFYLPDQPQTKGLYLNSRRDQYFLWTDPATLVGQNAVLCLDDENADAVALARRYFALVEPLPPVVVSRPGFVGPVKTWHLYRCKNFKGYDPLAHVAGY